MSEKPEKTKVQRNRKRIYETSPEETPVPEITQDLEPSAADAPAETAAESAPPESATAGATVDQGGNRAVESMAIVKHYGLWAAGAGVVPVPLLDMMAMLTVQMSMVRKLAELYGIPYSEQRSKAAVAGLIGGLNAAYLGGGALKMFPIFGIITLAAMPALNAAITYAVGKVFIQHFESGGTFLDFDPAKVKVYFEEQCREGK